MHQKPDLARAIELMLGCLDAKTARRWVATNLLAIAGGMVGGLAPLALKNLVDAAQSDPNLSAPWPIARLATVYLLCLAVGRILSEVRPMLASAAEQRLYGQLRQRFFRHTLHLPLEFHLNERAGATAHALQQGITGYQIIVYSLFNGIVPVVFEAITVTAVLLSLRQPVLTAILGATAIAYVAAAIARSRSLAKAAKGVSTVNAAIGGALAEGLTNIESIKCFGAEPRLIADFSDATATLVQQWSALHKQRLRGSLGLFAVFVLSVGAFIATSILGLRDGTLTIGGFVLANMYVVQVLRPLDVLAAAMRDVTQALAFIGPMLKILQTPSELPLDLASETIGPGSAASTSRAAVFEAAAPATEATTSTSSAAAQAPRIQFDDVCVTLGGGHAVLSQLTVDIPAGQSTAIVGASGSGKSTMARLLLRLWAPERGTILWSGQPIESMPLAVLRSRVAIVPQDTVLFNSTIAANISIGKPGATPGEIERAARLARLHAVVASLPRGYETVIGERGLKLSGGERQRLAIARAILKDPLVFVLDEATSMLDSATEQEILQDLRSISAGRTVIMIAHRLSALRHAEKIVVLAGGGVAEQGDHDTLLARGGLYASMWRTQQLTQQTGRIE